MQPGGLLLQRLRHAGLQLIGAHPALTAVPCGGSARPPGLPPRAQRLWRAQRQSRTPKCSLQGGTSQRAALCVRHCSALWLSSCGSTHHRRHHKPHAPAGLACAMRVGGVDPWLGQRVHGVAVKEHIRHNRRCCTAAGGRLRSRQVAPLDEHSPALGHGVQRSCGSQHVVHAAYGLATCRAQGWRAAACAWRASGARPHSHVRAQPAH